MTNAGHLWTALLYADLNPDFEGTRGATSRDTLTAVSTAISFRIAYERCRTVNGRSLVETF